MLLCATDTQTNETQNLGQRI